VSGLAYWHAIERGHELSARQIIETFEAWREAGAPIVMATVYDTLGSTYSKAGQRILIAADGDYRGLVSGGCLEGDLAERARAAVAADRPTAVTYDLRDEADEVFGLGVGCNGLLRVFLQPLTAARAYQPFSAIAERLTGRGATGLATVIASDDPSLPPGATALAHGSKWSVFGAEAGGAERLVAGARGIASGALARLEREHGVEVLYAPLTPIPRLLVLGAGLDAVPLVSMAAELGWFVTVADHRPAYVRRGGFERAERALLVEAKSLATAIDLGSFDAVIVMSHHLPTDREYLRQLAAVETRFLGVLGPRARRERLLADLGDAAKGLGDRLRGPVGLDIGADSSESIALSILAELQARFAPARAQ
jgi:xanthine/CO dehydrogenase XdhC/CoxF family maturation factor